MSDQLKKVSKKKILFVQIDEEITSIFEKIERLPYKEIYLVVPKRAILLQSIVNLKILKQKLEDIEKNIAIITNDPNGMKLALQAEITVFDQWDLENDATPFKEERDPHSALLKPIAATQNDINEPLPSRLPKKKSSIFEVIRELKHRDKGFSLRSYLADFKKNRLEHQAIHLSPGKKRWIAVFLMASFFIFFVVIYITLPGATILIEPTSNVLTKGLNVDLEPTPSETNGLTAYPVETEVEEVLSHLASGIENKGTNASGVLTIVNISGTERTLISSTRFQTDDGIVFRLQADVLIPSGTAENPGKVDVTVVADALDANGVAVGERGNIGPSRFFLPNLSEESQAVLYAESSGVMSGGSSELVTRVTEDDLKAAAEKLSDQLNEMALIELRKEVLGLGNLKGLNLKLLEDASSLDFGTVEVDLPYELVGQEMESFEVSGSLSVSGVSYDSDALYELLKAEMVSVSTPGKQLVSIDANSMSISVLESNPSQNSYTITAQIQGVEEYEIDSESDGGAELSKKIIEHIAGTSVEEAAAYIQNLSEVNKVEIKMWPVWSPTIPKLPDNIKIKSLSSGVQIE